MKPQYKVVKCSKCGEYQLTTSNTVSRCKYCGRSISISNQTIYYSSEKHKEALQTLYKYKSDSEML